MITEEYEVLELNGNPAKLEIYQKEMVEFYRKTIDVTKIKGDEKEFIFPYEGTLKLNGKGVEKLIIKLESQYSFEFDNLKDSATINGKFKIKKL